MKSNSLASLLDSLPQMRIGVIGDFCLDAYWNIDSVASTPSQETGLMAQMVHSQSYSLGGAGNVVSNLLALKVGSVSVFGVTGEDPFGRELRRFLVDERVCLDGLLVQEDLWDTPVYIKPIKDREEQNRIDLGAFNRLQDSIAEKVVEKLEHALSGLDVVIINQQWLRGLHTPFMKRQLNELIERNPESCFLTDCRDCSSDYPNILHKLSDHEAVKECGSDVETGDSVPREQVLEACERLYQKWGKTLFITRGPNGCVIRDESGLQEVLGLHIIKRTDPVGAGDSMSAGLAAGLAAGRTPVEAATFGNFVAGVTAQKLYQTGVASPEEVLAIGASPDYVYNPELAEVRRDALSDERGELDIIVHPAKGLRITHAIFDHDGTISTLRQGWENVMKAIMMKFVLGDGYGSIGSSMYSRVVRRVDEFIDKTTGIQTLVQMHGLVELIQEFEIVPREKILTPQGYKDIYNEALMEMVRVRMNRIQNGELNVSDFTIKNAIEFLRRLHQAGVRLYMASGTDVDDVRDEADALGYGHLFEGRIYGAVGDVAKEAKRQVLDRILRDVGFENAGSLVTFGDGPVELRETRKRGGLAIGLVSDEVRRFGVNPSKRARLIQAGAHMLIPDFSRADEILNLLGVDA